jgi:hypothetical protein
MPAKPFLCTGTKNTRSGCISPLREHLRKNCKNNDKELLKTRDSRNPQRVCYPVHLPRVLYRKCHCQQIAAGSLQSHAGCCLQAVQETIPYHYARHASHSIYFRVIFFRALLCSSGILKSRMIPPNGDRTVQEFFFKWCCLRFRKPENTLWHNHLKTGTATRSSGFL